MVQQMHDGGGGGTGFPRTNWYAMNVQQMWDYLRGQMDPESPYVAPHWDHVAGWQKAIELARLNKYRIEQVRDDIEEIWPSDTNEASAAYVAKLNELIASLVSVQEHSIKSHDYALDMVRTLSGTTQTVKELYDKWLTQQATISSNQQDYDSAGSGHAGRNAKSTATRNIETATAEQERLNSEARTAMSKLSTDLNLARAYIQPPPPYRAPRMMDPGSDEAGSGGGGGGSMNPPVLPPIVPAAAPAPMPPPAPMYKPVMTPLPSHVGPDLSGLAPAPTAPGPSIGGGAPLPSAPGHSPGTPLHPPGMPGVIGGAVRPGTGPGAGGRNTAPGVMGAGARTGMPAGGVIGGAPAAGRTAAASGAGGMRPNPPGGLIGGGAAGARTGTSGVAGARGGIGAGSGGALGGAAIGAAGRSGRNRDGEGSDFDADTAWDVAQGVTPVLDAPDAPVPIDPGPAIGLR